MLNIINKRFNRLVAIKETDITQGRYAMWECICICGNKKLVRYDSLIYNQIKSCGCLNDERRRQCKFNQPPKQKVCSICKQTKVITNFSIKGRYKNGVIRHDSRCKGCQHIIYKERHREIIKNKLCLSCGEKIEGRSRKCKDCIKTTADIRIDLKKRCIEYLGGKCNDCNFESNHYSIYDFHHIDTQNKKYKMSEIIHKTNKWEVIKEELDKCILLCSNCHRIRHERKNRWQ